MDNLNSPAHPILDSYKYGKKQPVSNGFTKLELASLMIAQGMLANSLALDQGVEPLHLAQPPIMAMRAVNYAKLILEEANK